MFRGRKRRRVVSDEEWEKDRDEVKVKVKPARPKASPLRAQAVYNCTGDDQFERKPKQGRAACPHTHYMPA